MEQLETMEYYILQTQDILNSVYKNKEQTNKLAQVYFIWMETIEILRL